MLTPKVVGKFLIGNILECPILYRLYSLYNIEQLHWNYSYGVGNVPVAVRGRGPRTAVLNGFRRLTDILSSEAGGDGRRLVLLRSPQRRIRTKSVPRALIAV